MIELNGSPPSIARSSRRVALGAAGAVVWLGFSMAAFAAAPRQMTFSSPEDATTALVAAAKAGDTRDLEKILGPMGRKLINSGDSVADRQGRKNFVSGYAQKHAIEKLSDNKAILIVHADDWPFPIPMVKQGNAWYFDTKAGADEILNRRIGKDELSAIDVSQAIVDAEHDYAGKDRTGTGYLEYAQKFVSSAGKRDGLYWPVKEGEESPIGPLVAAARAEGYGSNGIHEKRTPYHGYFYRLLKRQGPSATGGEYGYVVNGHMIGGFALVAFPAKYGDTGIMTFMVNQDGVIYEKNLGADTSAVAREITSFNPDASWVVHQ